MTWKIVEIWSSMYRRNIHVESMLIPRGMPVGWESVHYQTLGIPWALINSKSAR